MIGVNSIRHTRVYQEVLEECRQQTKLEMVPLLLELGLSIQEVAERLELDLESVRDAARNKTQLNSTIEKE